MGVDRTPAVQAIVVPRRSGRTESPKDFPSPPQVVHTDRRVAGRGLKVGRLIWDQDIGRFDSCLPDCGMAQLGSVLGS